MDRDNLITNRVTLVEQDDWQAGAAGAAAGLSATWACVNLIAGTLASLPFMVYRTETDGSRTVAREHPLYRLIHDSPNYDQSALDFWEFMAAAVELAGNAFAEIERLGGRIVALTPIRPDLVTVRRDEDGALRYRWTDEGQTIERGQQEVLHIRGFGGNPLGGMSTLSACRGVFGGALAVERTARSIFANGARPTGVLQTDKILKPDQRAELEGLLAEKYIGAHNTGRPMLLDAGLTWSALSIDPQDAEMLSSRKFSGEEICRVFGVPPAMVGYGDKASNWGTGKEQDVLGFQKFSLRRRAKRIEAACMRQLLSAEDRGAGIVIEIAMDAILRGDSEARARFYQVMTQIGAMTINQVRALENWAPVPGGDEPRMQSQNVPLGATAPIGAEPASE